MDSLKIDFSTAIKGTRCQGIENQTAYQNMNFKALISVFALFISSISALSVINFPLNLRVEPGSELSIQLEGNDIASGDHVRVELWDNQDDEDVNAAILGEELKVNSDLSVNFDIPANFPKTKNAFLRVYYKCHNTVSPRFSIKPAKNCLDNKKPHKPVEPSTIHPTPIVIYKPTDSHIAGTTATPIVIVAGPVATPVANGGSGVVAPIIAGSSISSAIRSTASVKSSATTMSTSTSTSSASVAKISAGSIVIALTVAFAMLF